MSGAWSKGTNKAVSAAPPPGSMDDPNVIRGSGGNNYRNNNNNNNNNNRGRTGGSSGGRGRGRGRGGRHNNNNNNNNGNHSRGGRGGRGGGRGRHHNNNNNSNNQQTDRITIKDVQLLEETGVGSTEQQQKVIRIDARELVRQRLQYVEPCTDFTPNPHCHWTAEDRIQIIQGLCSKVMELGDVTRNTKKPAKHETAPALEDCKPLEINEEKRWKSKAMEQKSSLIAEAAPEPETTEEIVNKARLILNKISWTTLDKLTAQFMEMTNLVHNEEVRKAITALLVEKAQLEPHFGGMYAQICAIIGKQVKTFKKELLGQCQKEFEIDVDHKIINVTKDLKDPEEIEYHSTLIRKAYIAHMKFLGELYLRDVVKLAIMMHCLDELLKDKTHEDSLECFVHLMSTTGQKLDAHAAQNDKNFDWQNVVDLRNSGSISNRIKFLLQDLLELKQRGWVQRRKVEKAKTIAEIHKEAAKEEKEGKMSSRRASQPNLRRSTSQPQVDDDGFTAINRASFKKVGSKNNLSTASPHVQKPAMSSLRRAVSQPAMQNKVPESPFDKNKIASNFGVPPSMPSMSELPKTVDASLCSKKIQSILKEYYVGGDTDDAVLSVDELVQASEDGAIERGARVIEGATLLAMEGKPDDVPKMLAVMVRCVQEGKILNASIVQGFQDPLEFLADIEIDAPLAGKHLAMIVSECLKLNALSLDFLIKASPDYFRTGGKAATFTCQVLKTIGEDPSAESLEILHGLMTDDEKTEFNSAQAMWDAKK